MAIFTDGVEPDFSAWTGTSQTNGTITADATYPHHGTNAAKCVITSANGVAECYKTIADQTTPCARAYIRTPASITSGNVLNIFNLYNTYTPIGRVYLSNVGGTWKWGLYYLDNGNPTIVYSAQQTPSASTYYCVEIDHVTGNGSASYKVYIDGNELTDISQTSKIQTSVINKVLAGFDGYPNDELTTIYIDCVVVDSTYVGTEASSYYPYINNVSNVDSVADIGTHSDFTKQQTAADSTYDTLTEADTDTGTSTLGTTSGTQTTYRSVAANEFRGQVLTAASTGEVASVVFYGRGGSTVNVKAVITDSSGNLLTNGVGNAVSVSTTAGSKTLTYTAGSRPLLTSGATYWIGLVPAGTLRLYYEATTGKSNKQDTTNSYTTPENTGAATDTTETWRALYANINNLNYELQLEEQFTAVPYDTASGFTLHVTTGAYSSPPSVLNVEVWNAAGSAWVSLGALTASTDNSFDVSTYATSANLYIRFHDGTVTDDNTQSTWQIDSVWLAAKYPKTLTANAELTSAGGSKELTANGNLTQTLTKTLTAAANLLQNFTKALTGNAQLLRNLTTALTANANLLRSLTKTFTSNANLLKSQTTTLTSNANLQRSSTVTLTGNANLTGTLTKQFTANANIQKNLSTTTTANGNLTQNFTKQVTSNANLIQPGTTALTANGNLQLNLSKTLTADGTLILNPTTQLTANAELSGGTAHYTLGFTAGATLVASPAATQGGGYFNLPQRRRQQRLSPQLLTALKEYFELKLQ
jgi:hypothetical protein